MSAVAKQRQIYIVPSPDGCDGLAIIEAIETAPMTYEDVVFLDDHLTAPAASDGGKRFRALVAEVEA